MDKLRKAYDKRKSVFIKKEEKENMEVAVFKGVVIDLLTFRKQSNIFFKAWFRVFSHVANKTVQLLESRVMNFRNHMEPLEKKIRIHTYFSPANGKPTHTSDMWFYENFSQRGVYLPPII